uniref:Uncharacterized protein n=1 Tax=Chenopodium quinoa TaxID=63459 RepID=A0A803NEU0_CHEQI
MSPSSTPEASSDNSNVVVAPVYPSWREFWDIHSFSLPASPLDATSRLQQNLTHFYANYLNLIFYITVFYIIFTETPLAVIIAAAIITACYLFCRLCIDSDRSDLERPYLYFTCCLPPVIGGLLRFLKGPIIMLREEYPKLGSVFTLNLVNKNITFLIGPEESAHFFKAPETDLSQQEVYRFNVPTFGPGVVFDVDYSIRQEQFRFFTEALRANKLKSYVDHMVMEAEEYFSKWGDSGEVDLKYELEHLIILTASRCLLGQEVRDKLFDDVSALFHDLDNGMLPISVIFPALLNRSTKDGRPTTEEEVTGLLIAALFAGQHTSSITSTWTGAYLLRYKEFFSAVVEEQRTVMKKHGENVRPLMFYLRWMSCIAASRKHFDFILR